MSAPCAELARLLGILPRYYDVTGVERIATAETRDALLGAMGHDPDHAGEALAGLRAADAGRRLPRWSVVVADGPVSLPLGAGDAWALEREDGETEEGRGPALGALPLGIHRLLVEGATTWLLSAPPRLPEPPRAWGVTLPLYGLKTPDRGGLGSYADLARAVAGLAGAGAAFVGINPIHAGFPEAPEAFSPYSPSHRRRLNTLHIEAGAGTSPGELIDYAAFATAQKAALERQFVGAPLPDAFHVWRATEAAKLERFAIHQALSEVHGPYWTDWPVPFRDPASRAVAAFAAERAGRVTFHAWAQWLAETQLGDARDAAAGTALGLYLDLAVGTHPAGAETWAHRGHFASAVSLGAPPDAFSPGGQRWQLAPFDPHALAADGFQPLAETLRAQFRFARLLRIDHILGFERAFWLPDSGAQGTYVDMPTEAMLAVARIEAARAGATIVGEDLGNIPEGLGAALAASGILGCRVAMFEQHWGGAARFKAADEYDRAALASFGTHDLPTFRGWQAATDIDWHLKTGAMDEDAALAARERRAAEVAAFADVAGGSDLAALDGFLADVASQLVALQIEDSLKLDDQANLPGTIDEHPNWRRRLPVGAEDLGGLPALGKAAAAMAKANRGEMTWTS